MLILLLLVDPPSFVQKLENLSSLVGSEVSLLCVVKGSEPMTVSWMKDNHELKEAEHIQLSYENNTALLHLTDVQSKDGGKYSCQAQNQAGSQTCSALLTVKGWSSHSSTSLNTCQLYCPSVNWDLNSTATLKWPESDAFLQVGFFPGGTCNRQQREPFRPLVIPVEEHKLRLNYLCVNLYRS